MHKNANAHKSNRYTYCIYTINYINLSVFLKNFQLKIAKIFRFTEKKIRYKKICYIEGHFYI